MLIFAIDDEPMMCSLLQKAIEEAAPEAEVACFFCGQQAIEAVTEEKMQPDVIFSDIVMPGLDGLELAVRLKTAAPQAKLIFVTGFTDYALKAYRLHASGYLLKPVEPAQIREELDNLALPELQPQSKDRIFMRCFGAFEAFRQGRPLVFERQQTKELLAFLIDRNGAFSSAEEIIAALWEDEDDVKAAKHRLRNLIGDLRKTLAKNGAEEILLRRRNQLAILTEGVDCDYYRMLSGDMDAVNAFGGEYMSQYSWAELTKGELYFRAGTVV